MPSYRDIASSFLAGEVDQATVAQVDDATRAHGATRIRNMCVRSAGGVKTRPGMRVLAVVSDTYLTPAAQLALGRTFRSEYWWPFAIPDPAWSVATSAISTADLNSRLGYNTSEDDRILLGVYAVDADGEPTGMQEAGLSATVRVKAASLRAPGTRPQGTPSRTTPLVWWEEVEHGPGVWRWERGTGTRATFTVESADQAFSTKRYVTAKRTRRIGIGWDNDALTRPTLPFPGNDPRNDPHLLAIVQYNVEWETPGIQVEVETGEFDFTLDRRNQPVRLFSMPLDDQEDGAVALGLLIGEHLKVWAVQRNNPTAGLMPPTTFAGQPGDEGAGHIDTLTNSGALTFVTGWGAPEVRDAVPTPARTLEQAQYDPVPTDGAPYRVNADGNEVEYEVTGSTQTTLSGLFTIEMETGSAEATSLDVPAYPVQGHTLRETKKLPPRCYFPNGIDWPVHVLSVEERSGENMGRYLKWGREAPELTSAEERDATGQGTTRPTFYLNATEYVHNSTALNQQPISGPLSSRITARELNGFRHPATIIARHAAEAEYEAATLEGNNPPRPGSPPGTESDPVMRGRGRFLVATDYVLVGVHQIGSLPGPRCMLYYQNRMLMAGTPEHPAGFWATLYGTVDGWCPLPRDIAPNTRRWRIDSPIKGVRLSRFPSWAGRQRLPEQEVTPLPALATDPLFVSRIGGREATIRFMYPGRRLVFFCDEGVLFLDGDSLDTTNIGFRWNTEYGIKPGVPPVGIGANRIAYVSNDGAKVWLMTYANERQGYVLTELSRTAPHLIRNPTDLILYDTLPDGATAILVVNGDGSIACCSIEPEGEWWAWTLWTLRNPIANQVMDVERIGDAVYTVTHHQGNHDQAYIEVFDGQVELDFCERTEDGTHRWLSERNNWDFVAEMRDGMKHRFYRVRVTDAEQAAGMLSDDRKRKLLADRSYQRNEQREREDLPPLPPLALEDVVMWQTGIRVNWTLETMPFVRRTGSGTTFTRRSITKEAFVDYEVQGERIDGSYSTVGPIGAFGGMCINNEDLSNEPQLFTQPDPTRILPDLWGHRGRFVNLAGWRNENTITVEGFTPVTVSSVSRKVFA